MSPVPVDFGFSQGYPNPFNPETTVDYQTALDGNVSVIVYNIMGKQIRALVHESKVAGYYKAAWNGRDDQGKAAPSGIYFIRMQSGDFNKVRKVMLMK
jgi:flagellar hook assembly protein FlgD